jgi:pimeloyl-ACP methyl ester carboxylesterase
VRDLHDLLTAAHIAPPYLLVGQSGGGFDVYHYTGRYPGDVVGLVLLDVPAGQATMSAADVAELAWDNPGNQEHVDYVTVERQMALHRLPIPAIPVTVVTAKEGQSAARPDEQRVWLKGSSHPAQVVLEGGTTSIRTILPACWPRSRRCWHWSHRPVGPLRRREPIGAGRSSRRLSR